MRYMILIYGDPALYATQTEEEITAEYKEYMAFGEEARKRGVNADVGDALQAPNTATSVRVRDGKTLITDGPYAETKEMLGGYYILDCKDLDQAIELAAMIPGAKNGTIEIRPVVESYQ
ncbi:MAG TPA: YciI family protein [Aggregatilineales bacterium]|nr:YciI family protein [Aggregatilineales bacterium]